MTNTRTFDHQQGHGNRHAHTLPSWQTTHQPAASHYRPSIILRSRHVRFVAADVETTRVLGASSYQKQVHSPYDHMLLNRWSKHLNLGAEGEWRNCRQVVLGKILTVLTWSGALIICAQFRSIGMLRQTTEISGGWRWQFPVIATDTTILTGIWWFSILAWSNLFGPTASIPPDSPLWETWVILPKFSVVLLHCLVKQQVQFFLFCSNTFGDSNFSAFWWDLILRLSS